MRDLNVITANYDAPVTGYPEGSYRNNPGDNTGSGIMAAMGNDIWYAISALIYKYLGDKNGNAETTTASDFVNAIDAALGSYSAGISNWDAATDYSTSGMVSVMRYGVQFTSILATGNVGKDPILEPTFWLPVPSARDLFMANVEGTVFQGGSAGLHNHVSANYKQFFSLGTHRIGGASGYAFTAWGVHLDGSAVGSTDLSDIVEAWHLKSTWAPGSLGSRTLIDAKGRVMRFMDQSGGRADLIGEVLADQMQGHWHNWGVGGQSGSLGLDATNWFNTVAQGGFYTGAPSRTLDNTVSIRDAISDGTNGTPRTGTVTADKSVTVGVPYVVICVPA